MDRYIINSSPLFDISSYISNIQNCRQPKALSHFLSTSTTLVEMIIPNHKAEHQHDSETSSLSSLGKEIKSHPSDMAPHGPQFEPLNTIPTANTMHRTYTNRNEELVNLPSRTLGPQASLQEYTEETVSGHILKEVRSNKSGKIERWELVTWKIDDPENPKNWSKAYKWWCTMCVAVTCFVVALNSAVVTADIGDVAEEFGCSEEVALLSITLFVMGFGIGMLSSLTFVAWTCTNNSDRSYGIRSIIRDCRSTGYLWNNLARCSSLHHSWSCRKKHHYTACGSSY